MSRILFFIFAIYEPLINRLIVKILPHFYSIQLDHVKNVLEDEYFKFYF